MKILEKLAEFKQHTYTPNSFYDKIIEFITQFTSGDFLITLGMDSLTDVVLATINAGMIQEVVINLGDTDGEVHDWFNGDLAVAFTTSGDGTALDGEGYPITSATFVKGVATFDVTYGGTFINDETVTLVVGTSDTLLGFSLTAKTTVIATVEGA